MFDPLSNFKLNKILSAVNALPTTLASSFTEVKNAIAGVDEKVVYNGEGIDTLSSKIEQVSTIKTDQMLYIPQDVTYVDGSKTETSGSTVLNITGSGSLLFAVFSSGTNVNGDFSITLDGKVFKYAINRDMGGGILCKNEIIGITSGDLVVASGRTDHSTYNLAGARYLTKNILKSGANLSASEYLFSNVLIPFNQSLKVSLSNDEHYQSIDYAIAYILND